MCLVSYVPTTNGFILSSNRDEAPNRNSLAIQSEEFETKTIYYPADTQGGSWIFCTDTGNVVCLLNGAFSIHKHLPPYRMSRGLVLKALILSNDPISFIEDFDFNGIEPFTVVIVFTVAFFEFRWDGKLKHLKSLKRQKEYVWSSCTLYTPTQQKEREGWFFDLQNDPKPTLETVKEVHLTGGKENMAYGFRMNREERVKTISLTQIEISKNYNSIAIMHNNLINNNIFTKSFRLSR